jgi:hypothetical protein
MTPLIIDYIKKHPKWEFSLQLHKYINVPWGPRSAVGRPQKKTKAVRPQSTVGRPQEKTEAISQQCTVGGP